MSVIWRLGRHPRGMIHNRRGIAATAFKSFQTFKTFKLRIQNFSLLNRRAFLHPDGESWLLDINLIRVFALR